MAQIVEEMLRKARGMAGPRRIVKGSGKGRRLLRQLCVRSDSFFKAMERRLVQKEYVKSDTGIVKKRFDLFLPNLARF